MKTMQKSFIKILTLAIASVFIVSCSNSKKMNKTNETEKEAIEETVSAGPPTIIYKTTKDYADKIPVTLSEDKSEIVSYPGIKDIYYKGEFAYPTPLNDGYLLDNRGINANTAFLKLTYEEYSKLESTPSKDELFEMIIAPDPITEMYNCGNKFKFKNIEQELNNAIDNKELSNFKKLK